MKFLVVLLSVVCLLAIGASALRKEVHPRRHGVVQGEFIVVLGDQTDQAQHLAEVAAKHNVQPIRKYSIINGYHAKLSTKQLLAVRSRSDVQYVEENGVVHAYQTCNIQRNSVPWGINRLNLDDVPVLDDRFIYADGIGTGVTVYVIDTGVYLEHVDFNGRASFGFKAESSWSDRDANGHGTHVASTAAGETYGVAKNATIIAVKVLGDNGSGSNAGVLAGVEFVAKHNSQGSRKVANMSLGGGKSSALNAAVDNLFKSGAFLAVAAGNDDSDAKNYSPASASLPLCVGSTGISVKNNDEPVDNRSSFSNWGPDIDIFAPGSLITAAWIGSPTATRTISGTSMASPHAAGVAAAYLSKNPTASAADVKSALLSSKIAGVIELDCSSSACGSSKNLMLSKKCLQ